MTSDTQTDMTSDTQTDKTSDKQTYMHTISLSDTDMTLDTQTFMSWDTQTYMTSYLNIKMKSYTYKGMKLEIYRLKINMKQTEIPFVTAQ